MFHLYYLKTQSGKFKSLHRLLPNVTLAVSHRLKDKSQRVKHQPHTHDFTVEGLPCCRPTTHIATVRRLHVLAPEGRTPAALLRAQEFLPRFRARPHFLLRHHHDRHQHGNTQAAAAQHAQLNESIYHVVEFPPSWY